MKDLSEPLRRVGGWTRYSRRVRDGYRAHLSDVWSWDQGAVRKPPDREGAGHTVRKPRERTNWKVMTDQGEVVAVEPNREFEHVFDGPDPFMAALEYAAKQLREGA